MFYKVKEVRTIDDQLEKMAANMFYCAFPGFSFIIFESNFWNWLNDFLTPVKDSKIGVYPSMYNNSIA